MNPQVHGADIIVGTPRSEAEKAQLAVENPATGELLGTVPNIDPESVPAIFDRAEAGARIWRETGVLERAAVMLRAAQNLRVQHEDLAQLIVKENGKTIKEARGEVLKSAEFFEFYASLSRQPVGHLLADARPNTQARVIYEPIGVVLAITPWNDALLTPARKIAPALFAGNAVVLKPATDTPLIAIELAKALHEAGLPEGVLSLVTGRGGELSDVLIEDSRIAAVTFTGSTDIGLHLQRQLAGRNVRIQTEMGGKNAAVLMADADLNLAVDALIAGSFGQAGQRCTATSRVLVHADIAAAVVDLFTQRSQALVVGNGADESTEVGPVINRKHRDQVLQAIETAREQGSDVCSANIDHTPEDGHFVAPTVVVGVTEDSSLWREEVFGPVVALRTFTDLDDVISEVNRSSYGLSAAIFTASLDTAEKFIALVDSGQVSVNLPTIGWDIHHPFGGFKLSGSGYKEQGLETLNFYRRVKTAAIRSK